MKPIIGIVSRPSVIFGKYDIQCSEETYKNAIIECGGIPITILPPQNYSFNSVAPRELPRLTDSEKEDLNQVLDMCDAILSPGGLKTYEYDYYICSYAKEHNIPLLGICAGMQVMALTDAENKLEKNENEMHKQTNEGFGHKIIIRKGTLLHNIMGKDSIDVNSYHSYHATNAGNNIVSATCSEDNIIEAIEDPNLDYFLGVQWHPEKLVNEDENSKLLFESFIDAANQKKLRK